MHEYAEIKTYKHSQDGTELRVLIPGKELGDYLKRFAVNGIVPAELRLDDTRFISAEQRKKTYAMLRDIATFTGHMPEEIKELMKYYYICETGEPYFSLSNCSVTTARKFINHLIEFCFIWDIPLAESGLNRHDDIDTYLYMCLKHKKCVICGKKSEEHHWNSIGMGRDRTRYDDSLHEKIALCRKHHNEIHKIGRDTFAEKYHVKGVLYK